MEGLRCLLSDVYRRCQESRSPHTDGVEVGFTEDIDSVRKKSLSTWLQLWLATGLSAILTYHPADMLLIRSTCGSTYTHLSIEASYCDQLGSDLPSERRHAARIGCPRQRPGEVRCRVPHIGSDGVRSSFDVEGQGLKGTAM